MLKETFIQLITKYTDNDFLKNELWTEIEESYSIEKRQYHNLFHLENILSLLTEIKNEIQNWETILFTLFYHDVIYDPNKSDNEEKSAELAEKRMAQIQVSKSIIDNCKRQILATKNHIDNSDNDTNYFIDSDLSILGQDYETYNGYSKKIRIEYLFFPSVIYNKGRIKVLEHFLNFKPIFKTEYFNTKFEKKARINILNEIESLRKIKDEYYLTHSNRWCFSIENDGDWYEFFIDGYNILKTINEVEITNYYPGFFDSGYCRFTFKKVKLNLEYDGMIGIDLRTEPYPSESDLKIAKEIYELLKQVRNIKYT